GSIGFVGTRYSRQAVLGLDSAPADFVSALDAFAAEGFEVARPVAVGHFDVVLLGPGFPEVSQFATGGCDGRVAEVAYFVCPFAEGVGFVAVVGDRLGDGGGRLKPFLLPLPAAVERPVEDPW